MRTVSLPEAAPLLRPPCVVVVEVLLGGDSEVAKAEIGDSRLRSSDWKLAAATKNKIPAMTACVSLVIAFAEVIFRRVSMSKYKK